MTFTRRIVLLVSTLIGLLSIVSIVVALVLVYELDTSKLDDHEVHLLKTLEVVNWFFAAIFTLSIALTIYMIATNPAYRNLVVRNTRRSTQVDLKPASQKTNV